MITTSEDGETGGAGSALRCPPSKLRPPRPHVELVAREALVERLLQSSEPLVVVSAPAGSGKTVLLTQWLRAESSPGAWLRLDGNDNDPLVLLRGLAVALDQVLGIDPEILQLLQLRRPPLVDRILPELATAVAGSPPFVMVLDDAQLVQNEAAWAHVGLVLENLPEGAQLVVASRSDPPLPLGRLRARGELLELRFEELAFDRDEALALLRLHGVGEGGEKTGGPARKAEAPDTIAALLEATEGGRPASTWRLRRREVGRRRSGCPRCAATSAPSPTTCSARCSSGSPPSCSGSCSTPRSSTS